MTFMKLNSADLAFRVLCHAIELAETGEADDVLALGLSAEDVASLRQMTVADISRISATQAMVEIRINPSRLRSAVAALTNAKRVSVQITYLARAGAPATLLAELFRITVDEAQAHMAVLGMPRQAGRPPMPTTKVRDEIHAWWATNQKTPVCQRWMDLHQEWPDLSLATLNAVVNEFTV